MRAQADAYNASLNAARDEAKFYAETAPIIGTDLQEARAADLRSRFTRLYGSGVIDDLVFQDVMSVADNLIITGDEVAANDALAVIRRNLTTPPDPLSGVEWSDEERLARLRAGAAVGTEVTGWNQNYHTARIDEVTADRAEGLYDNEYEDYVPPVPVPAAG